MRQVIVNDDKPSAHVVLMEPESELEPPATAFVFCSPIVYNPPGVGNNYRAPPEIY